MITLLCTKQLSKSQKELVNTTNFEVLCKSFIQTKAISFKVNKTNDYLLFTSKNAVKSIAKSEYYPAISSVKCLCVGIKTKKYLEKKGFTVVAYKNYASELGELIKTDYALNSFTFFSGSLRRETLPEIFKSNKIEFEEIKTYETILSPKRIKQKTNGILFFSPSAVESYCLKNNIENQVCFCIGTTTAKALEYKTKNIIIAPEQTVESVIETAINHWFKA